MVQNDPERPEIARESQDVESPPLRAQQIPHHTGRGKQIHLQDTVKTLRN